MYSARHLFDTEAKTAISASHIFFLARKSEHRPIDKPLLKVAVYRVGVATVVSKTVRCPARRQN